MTTDLKQAISAWAQLLGGDDAAERAKVLAGLVVTIENKQRRNKKLAAYYEGIQRVRMLGIAIPKSIERQVKMAIGWPTIAVDAFVERLNPAGWFCNDPVARGFLTELDEDNDLDVKLEMLLTDASVHGVTFAGVSPGADGEPEVVWTVESPLHVSGLWSPRMRRLDAAAKVGEDDLGNINWVAFYEPDRTTRFRLVEGRWQLAGDPLVHGRDAVPMVPFVHRPRSSRLFGSSRITPAVIAYADSGVRTMVQMEVNREIYASPARYALNTPPGAFRDKSGEPLTAWEAVLGGLWNLEYDPDDPDVENAPKVEVGQFDAASPQPYVAQLETLASMFAAEAAIPTSYMGFNTQNPPSGDGSRMLEARLIAAAERGQRSFGAARREMARQALLITGREARVQAKWLDAATPTKAATADAAGKLIAAELMPAQSRTAREYAGLAPDVIDQLEAEERDGQSGTMLATLRALADARRAAGEVPVVPEGEAA